MRKSVYVILLVAALCMILFRMEISRYVSDIQALLVGGVVLAEISGGAILITLFEKGKV